MLRILVRTATEKPVRALHDVSFRVEAGEVVGIVGPNGAGKSTLLRAITTLLIPTEGSIFVGGERLDPSKASMRNRFGLSLPDDRSFHYRLTGRQNLAYFAALAGLEPSRARNRIEQAMNDRGLAGNDKAVFGYSSGMLAQLSLARATLHDPSLLVLDEPTRSLDPVAGLEFCTQVRRLAADGRAVLLASHRLDEVVRSCDRVVALVDGRIAWQGPADHMADDPSGLAKRLGELASSLDSGSHEHGEEI